MRLLLLLLQLLTVALTCSLQKSVSCRDEIVSSRSNYTRDVEWDATPALRFDYQYSQTDKGLLINLKAMWRVLRTEKFNTPIRAFEISLLDLTENRYIEVRSASISSPEDGIVKLPETVEFFTRFATSLEFGHDYEIELRFLPLGTNGSFKKRLSIPPFPTSGECETDSALARDKEKYAIYVSDTRKFPLTSSVRIEFHTAPRAFCFQEYTIEVYETDNPSKPLAKSIVLTTDSTHVVKQEFTSLPFGIHLSIKIYPTEVLHSSPSECICSNCNCLVTQTKSFLFPTVVLKESPKIEVPSIADGDSSSFNGNLLFLIAIPLLLLIAILAIIINSLRILIISYKHPRENVKLISEWKREEKMPIVGSPQLIRNGSIWVIGLNTVEEHKFLYKLSSHLHPSTRLIYAPDDLHDGDNRWKWMSSVNRGVDVILLLLRESSLSLYKAGTSSDPFETLFIEQMTLLYPADNRIVTVSLDDCTPTLFNSSPIIYRDPRDFPLLTQCLSHRGLPLTDPILPPLSPPLSPSISLRSDQESVSDRESSIEGDLSKDSGFISNPSPPISPPIFPPSQRSAFPYLDSTAISVDTAVFAN